MSHEFFNSKNTRSGFLLHPFNNASADQQQLPLQQRQPKPPNGNLAYFWNLNDSTMTQRNENSFETVNSAESLVGRVLVEHGLGKYCDLDFIRYTSKEMQEALNLTREEMDTAAHQLMAQNHGIAQNLSKNTSANPMYKLNKQ